MKKAFLLATIIGSLFMITSCNDSNESPKSFDFEWTPKTPKVNEVVTFAAISINQDLTWNFGDGSSDNGAIVKHTYTTEGTYTVTLSGKNILGTVEEVSKTITVGEGGSGPNVGPSKVIVHDSSITKDELWLTGSVHRIKINLDLEAQLTIQPGVTVLMDNDCSLRVGYAEADNCELIAKGTANQPIRFISSKKNAPGPTWDYIYFGESNSRNSVMEYCIIEGAGGYNSRNGAVTLYDTSITFNHNTIKKTKYFGVYADNKASFESFNNNTIDFCEYGAMSIEANAVETIGDNNIFKNGVRVSSNLNKSGEHIWPKINSFYYFTNTIDVKNNAKLIIEPGTTLKFKKDTSFRVGYQGTGSLIAEGTSDNPITFTTTHKELSPGAWYGLYFGENNLNTTSLKYCNIYGGGGYNSGSGSIKVDYTTISMDHCTISQSANFGIHAGSDAYFGSFTNNTIKDSESSSMVVISNNVENIGEGNNIANDGFGIKIVYDLDKKGEHKWLKQTCPYTLAQSVDINSTQGTTLIIEPGATIQFAKDTSLRIGYDSNESGKLIAKGTADEPITFNVLIPGTYSYGLLFSENTQAGSIMEHCIISNGGAYTINAGNITCRSISIKDTPIIRNCTIKNSKNWGIYVKNANPLIENCTYENNAKGDVNLK